MFDIRDHGGIFGGSKYRKGSYIPIESLGFTTPPFDIVMSYSTATAIQCFYIDNGYLYVAIRESTVYTIYKYSISLNRFGKQQFNQLAVKQYSNSYNSFFFMLFPTNASYFFTIWGGNVIAKYDKSTLNQIASATVPTTTIMDGRITDDGNSVTLACNDSSNDTVISLYKYDLNLNLINSKKNIPQWNFNALFIGNDFLYVYDSTNGYLINLKTFVQTTTYRYIYYDNSQVWVASARDVIVEGNSVYIFNSSTGILAKFTIDVTLGTWTLVYQKTFSSGGVTYYMFNYNANQIYLSNTASIVDGVLIDKNTATVQTAPPFKPNTQATINVRYFVSNNVRRLIYTDGTLRQVKIDLLDFLVL